MVKKYVLTFSISVLILFSICIIMLMIMIPQQQASLTGPVQNYEKVNTTDFQFVKTKDVSKDSLTKEYEITEADIALFKKYNQYKAGNSDPFTPAADLEDAANGGNQTDTDTDTTNSNGGTQNPPSTNK